uniref:K Homology domain-containing protein n=1 Tax=Davidia involucrata TaxID=16924 RepID=A0A5B7C233_DAVIN
MQSPSHDRRRRHHHHDAAKRGGPKPLESPITLYPGQVVFRLLCHVNTVGGVKGNSGVIIKQLEHDTGAKIRVEDTIPNCHERVINVIGFATLDRKIALGVEGGVEEEFELSQAQEGLIRVFERVLKVEGVGDGVIGCRLLAGHGQIGALMGKRGCIVGKIRKDTGAKVKVLPAEQLPACGSPAEELIQIMGGILAVKKALVAVSRRLQDHPPMERAPLDISSYGAFPDPHAEFPPQHSSLLPPLPGNSIDYASTGYSLSADTDRILSLDKESTQHEVVFRLLCPTSAVGGVIGKGATIVRALENETGASIKIAASVDGSKERVATVSALEQNSEPLYSPAQIAIVRVFGRCVKVGIEQGHVSGMSKGEMVTARLLVASNQVDCLIDGRKVASEISTVSGVEIQILEGDLVPNCSSENDKVVQIIGEYENVKGALFQVTGKLRDNVFSSMVFDGAGARHNFYSAIPDGSPYGRGRENASPGLDHSAGLSPFDREMTLTMGIGHLRLPRSPSFEPLQIMGEENLTGLTNDGGGLTTFGGRLEQGSIDPAVVTKRTVEVVVPEHVFGSIYGVDGSNLARMKQISGAKVIVQDPCRGESEGKVIISGTLDQTRAAQSLLQAFILTGQ